MLRKSLTVMIGAALCAGVVMRAAGPSSVVDAGLAGHRYAVKPLLPGGADVTPALGDGMTALRYAAVKNDPELARMLLAAGANIKAATRLGGYTPALLAAKGGNAAALEVLLS